MRVETRADRAEAVLFEALTFLILSLIYCSITDVNGFIRFTKLHFVLCY